MSRTRILHYFKDAKPRSQTSNIVSWCESHVRLPGSARSEQFSSKITPWIVEPLQAIHREEVRVVTFVKPVQSGGSVLGECTLCYWLATNTSGDVQCNWQTDDNADARWDKRTFRIIKACDAISLPQERFGTTKGLILFPSFNFLQQGVFTKRRVASDSIRYQINEEIHDEDGWLPGRLEQAWGRTTAHWNHKILNISNAGRKGSELHKAFESGTMRHWQVPCPVCGRWHAMRTRWDDKKPELGGLRYDSDKARMDSGEYDYKLLEPTIRYQFPCGHEIADDLQIRRKMSLQGRYSKPHNEGADGKHESYTLSAVSVDYIPWLQLIKQKHSALKSLKFGDNEPWKKYQRERECVFAGEEDRPTVGRLVVKKGEKKRREGLPNRVGRLCGCDFQHGEFISKGELPYWWVVIRDVDSHGNSLLVYEGRVATDDDLARIIKEHEVSPWAVVCDSGHATTHVYQFCLKHGYNAIKGAGEASWTHPDGARRIFSPAKPIHGMMSSAPLYEYDVDSNPDPKEPMFWHYSKSGIRDRLAWLRSSSVVKWEVPEDVSDDYHRHMESEELEKQRNPKTGEETMIWVQRLERNDLFVCECYIAMMMDMDGLIGNIGT